MTAPSRFFVRVWTVDPAGEGPDEEKDTDILDGAKAETVARRAAAALRRSGKTAAAFVRKNVRIPGDIGYTGRDLPARFYEFEEEQVDEAEADREAAERARAKKDRPA